MGRRGRCGNPLRNGAAPYCTLEIRENPPNPAPYLGCGPYLWQRIYSTQSLLSRFRRCPGPRPRDSSKFSSFPPTDVIRRSMPEEKFSEPRGRRTRPRHRARPTRLPMTGAGSLCWTPRAPTRDTSGGQLGRGRPAVRSGGQAGAAADNHGGSCRQRPYPSSVCGGAVLVGNLHRQNEPWAPLWCRLPSARTIIFMRMS